MKKGIVGLVILICVFIAVAMSTRGIAVDISQEDRLTQIEKRLVEAEKRLSDVELRYKGFAEFVTAVEESQIYKEFKKNPGTSVSLGKVSPILVKKEGKNQVYKPDPGQTVYLNSAGTKFHFWTGCTWFGVGDEATLETATEQGAKACILCSAHKVIKQK